MSTILKPISVSTYNIHKGMSPLNRRVMVGDMAGALQTLSSDIVFLQEVQGKNLLRAASDQTWPGVPQHQFLAKKLGSKATYGLNASYEYGHHGNAVLSKFPLEQWCNLDLSVNRFESRGLLHCVLKPQGWEQPVAALCGHFNLLARDRRKQLEMLANYIRTNIPDDMPLILAGDFNDWKKEACDRLFESVGLSEVFDRLNGACAKSFPARMPFLSLDRIYVRGLIPLVATVHEGKPWSQLSDHLPLTATLVPAPLIQVPKTKAQKILVPA